MKSLIGMFLMVYCFSGFIIIMIDLDKYERTKDYIEDITYKKLLIGLLFPPTTILILIAGSIFVIYLLFKYIFSKQNKLTVFIKKQKFYLVRKLFSKINNKLDKRIFKEEK